MWEILAAPWFTDAPLNIHDKGAVEVMHGKWVIELAEMDALSKYESQTIKGFLTRTEDRCRMAYARKAMSFPRQCIFVGSINPEQTGWLKDRTGNRRFWPLAVGNIDLAGLREAKDALWAEALEAFEKGEKLYVEEKGMRDIMAMQVESRMQEDPWFGTVEDYLYTHTADFVVKDRLEVSPSDLYGRAIGGNAATFGYREAGRVASILKILGYEKVVGREKQGYVYAKEYMREV
jgi:predicted P-loop ATPase